MTSVSVHKVHLPDSYSKNLEFERPQVNSLHCNNTDIRKFSDKNKNKIIFLKDLNHERRAIKSNRTNDNSPNLELIKKGYEKKNNAIIFKEKSESCDKNQEMFEKMSIDQNHIKMSDLEALEENWKQMKIEHEQKIIQSSGKDLTKTKNFINNYRENPSNNNTKIMKHLVPRSRINLQVKEENNIVSKSLNENDFLKTNENADSSQEESNKTINTQREFNSKEIENILQIEISMENERKPQEPVKQELKNQMYMKTIFEKYSNIYQKKIPEATKIGNF